MILNKKEREALRMMFDNHCAYCGCVLPEKWHADHIEAIMRDGKWVKIEGQRYTHKFVQTGTCQRPENDRKDGFYPACVPCNINKSCMPIEAWRKCLQDTIRVLRENYAPFRHAERFGLVAVAETKVVFYFEKFHTTQL